MKILKIIGLVLGVLVGIFLLLGLIKPKVELTNTFTFDRPVEETWQIFNMTEHMGDWLEGFKTIETISETPDKVGSKFKLTFENEGQTFHMHETLTDWKENELFGFDLTSDFWNGHNEVRFVPKGDQTEVTYVMTGKGANLFSGATVPFFKSAMKERNDDQYMKLKALVENYKFPEPEPVVTTDSTSTNSL